jgi:Cu/Ag efflux pump CusA
MRRPFAIAVIGGILSSTILGLVVLPILRRLLIGARPAKGE